MEFEDRTQTAYSEGRTSTLPKVFASPDGRERCPAEAGPVRKAVSLGRECHLEVHSGKIGAVWCEILGRERRLEVHRNKIGDAWCEFFCSFISSQFWLHLIAKMLCDAEWKGLRKVLGMFMLILSHFCARFDMMDVF